MLTYEYMTMLGYKYTVTSIERRKGRIYWTNPSNKRCSTPAYTVLSHGTKPDGYDDIGGWVYTALGLALANA